MPAQVCVVLLDLADALADVVVVGIGRVEEDHAALLHRLHRPDDVVRSQRDVLGTGATVELEVLLDLALALADGRLVERKLDLACAVCHHLRHERGILGRDVLVGEVDHLRHPEHALVERDPLVHAAELDIADDVIDRLEPDTSRWDRVARDGGVAGLERPGVVLTVDERVDRVAIRGDGGHLDRSVLVLEALGLGCPDRTVLHGLRVRLGRVGNRERDVFHTISVSALMSRDLVVFAQRRRDDEADASLRERVGGAVAHARLRAGIRRQGEPERMLVEVRGLLGVPDPELDVVPAVERHEVQVRRNVLRRFHVSRGAR